MRASENTLCLNKERQDKVDNITMKKVLIIDTKAGNLFSLQAAIERLGASTQILSMPNDEPFDAIVIPGQGRFGTVMENVQLNGWDKYLKQG